MSAVLSPWFSVVLLLVCGSSEGLENITKEPGGNVTLTCRTENNHTLIVLEWTSEGLQNKTVFVFRDGRPFPARQHESYENRVFPKDSQMKNGNLSVVLENVTMNDTGTYQCKVRHENDPPLAPLNLISSIHLSVVPPGDPSPGDPSPGDPSPGQQGGLEGDQEGKKEDGGTKKEGLGPGGITGIVVSVLAAVVLVAVVGLWIYRRRCPNQRRSNII
ncbi:uncharacterized protein LOC144987429 [Oryzias latipes]